MMELRCSSREYQKKCFQEEAIGGILNEFGRVGLDIHLFLKARSPVERVSATQVQCS